MIRRFVSRVWDQLLYTYGLIRVAWHSRRALLRIVVSKYLEVRFLNQVRRSLRPGPFARAVLWLYLRPYDWGLTFTNALVDTLRLKMPVLMGRLINRVTNAITALLRVQGRILDYGSRADAILHDEYIDEGDKPYNPTADGGLIRRAALVVAGTIGALILFCSGGALLAPEAMQIAYQLMSMARACVSGVGR